MSERPQDPVPPQFQDSQPGAQPVYGQYQPYPPSYPQPYLYPQYPGYPPPYGYPGYPAEPPPPNYLGWAIGAIFLFWPVAIAALVKSGQVERFWAMGQRDLARQASATTKTLCVVATVVGAVTIVFSVMMFVILLSAIPALHP